MSGYKPVGDYTVMRTWQYAGESAQQRIKQLAFIGLQEDEIVEENKPVQYWTITGISRNSRRYTFIVSARTAPVACARFQETVTGIDKWTFDRLLASGASWICRE